jgi:hypothetical protein
MDGRNDHPEYDIKDPEIPGKKAAYHGSVYL